MKKKFYALKKRALKKGIPLTITFDFFRNIKTENCYYCGVSQYLLRQYAELLQTTTPWMTLDRKDNQKGYTPDNVVAACFFCNRTKGSFFSSDEMIKIGREFIAPKIKALAEEAWGAFEKEL